MAQQALKQNSPVTGNSRNALILGALATITLIVLSFWGGSPSTEKLPVFLIGIGVLIVAGLGIGALGWYLLFRPTQAKVGTTSPLPAVARRIVGALLIVCMAMEALGGVWDEVWHRKYGIPFGKDFFWRPHILIYIGLLSIIALATISWFAIVRRGRGSWVGRFRSDPMLGMLVLTGLFLVYAVPSDPIWHSIYGTDLSAFSIPHVLLALLGLAAMFSGLGLYLSGIARRAWRSVLSLNATDIVPVLAFAVVPAMTITLLVVDWYGLTPEVVANRSSAVFQRPDWALPVFLSFVAVLLGNLVNRSLRCYGAATLVGILAAAIRFTLTSAFDAQISGTTTWLLIIPPMFAIDVAYAVLVNRKQETSWLIPGIVGAVGMLLVSVPLINKVYLYPEMNMGNLPMVALTVIAASLIASWLAALIGDYLGNENKHLVEQADEATSRTRWLVPAMVIATIVFVTVFVLTAKPPIS